MKHQWKWYLGIAVFLILLNITAWLSRDFCDWYVYYITPVWVNTYARLMNLVPISMGEILIIIGVIYAVFLLIAVVIWGIKSIVNKHKGLKKKNIWAGKIYRFTVWVILLVISIMSLNYTILYHTTSFHDKYMDTKEKDYHLEELIAVRNFVVTQCNELALKMNRDEQGDVVYTSDMEQTAITAMRSLGTKIQILNGFYPTPKKLLLSDLMCQQYMMGYYFPFSMEANYNNVMYIMNKPTTMCHELAHVKGFIQEDEANFVSFLACTQSSDIVFQYSGYLGVLYYLDNDFYQAIGKNRQIYEKQITISDQVIKDNVFVKQTEWDRINEEALVDTEIVSAVSDQFTETYLKLNGVSDGTLSYGRVVKLLLQYYEGRLF